MKTKAEAAGSRACWFVGAVIDGEDQVDRFIEEGIWETGYTEKYRDLVNSVKPDDRIAIKATYTRKNDLPFDNRGKMVSTMVIKATGRVTENPGNGHSLRVDWTEPDEPREWYFYTNRSAVWRVLPGKWMADALIGFAFDNVQQNYDRFRNHPYWHERYGDIADAAKRQFEWTGFYSEVADKLLAFRNNREDLINWLNGIASELNAMGNLTDMYSDGTSGPLRDICPFTVFGTFNRGISNTNRKAIAAEFAEFLNVTEPVPESFDAIPVLNNMSSWLFRYGKDRGTDDIDALWDLFHEALEYSDEYGSEDRSALLNAYDNVAGIPQVGWKATIGLYWIRPWDFPPLDAPSRSYIEKKLGIEIGRNGPGGRCSASDYFKVRDDLEARFQEEAYPVHSFPELSLAAWHLANDELEEDPVLKDSIGEDTAEGITRQAPIEPYSLEDILADGCFLAHDELNDILSSLIQKKNLILQGPPGTGKTWLSKRLAYALIGERNEKRVRAIQFHPNMSYEDLVRGWRPSGDGTLALVDGPLMEMIRAASRKPSMRYVLVIEEINRGNPAQIFGEMLTLLEADKRNPDESLELCYRRDGEEGVSVPDNLFIIGTMNLADRSLALVDFAFRRRFAFVDLKPSFGHAWREWVHEHSGIDMKTLSQIERGILAVNEEIASDPNLGVQFRIGHSYVTPSQWMEIRNTKDWFLRVVETEIGPLLEEYWFDDRERARVAIRELRKVI